jgi:hypothetical protein
MKNSDYMNYLALNQNILNKTFVIGGGPQSKNEKTPITTSEGTKVFLNGVHVIPENSDIIKCYNIGTVTHPDAMMGMPGSSGDLNYQICITEKEYLVLVSLKLSEFSNGKSKPAIDLLGMVQKESLPPHIQDHEEYYGLIAQEVLYCHFDSLFQYYDNVADLKDWDFDEDDALFQFVQTYFEKKKG